MRQIRDDLWETRPDAPFPGLTTHAYLWCRPGRGNVLFYNTASGDDLDEMDRLGGVAHQYLSHQDEISPALNTFANRFGAVLHVNEREAGLVAEVRRAEVTFGTRGTDDNGVEIIPTPGHTPGSTCYVVTGDDGLTYLFTGDTIYLGADGTWSAGYIPGHSDPDDLAATLELLAGLVPDLVASSAFAGDHGAHLLERPWSDCVGEALAGLERADR